MKVKQLKEILGQYGDDAELIFELSANSTELSDMNFDVVESVDPNKYLVFLEKDSDTKPFFESQIRLGLPAEFLELCEGYKIEPETVLHGFIADLCELRNSVAEPRADNLSSNGSDERMLANQYFERVGYGQY